MHVNKDVFENKWEQIRAQSQVWWGLFSDDDLNKVAKAPIKRDKYAMMLRVKYGYTHERAKEEINKRITDLEANPSSNELMLDNHGSSNARRGESASSVQSLVNAKDAPLDRGGTNPSAAGSNKKNQKGR